MITIRFLRVRFNKVVCVYKSALNCCVRFQRVRRWQHSEIELLYNDDLPSRRISVVQNISLSLSSKEEDTPTTTKKNTDFEKKERQKHKSRKWLLIFFASKKPLSAALFGCFRVRRIIWCVNSRLCSLLFSLGSERHTKTRRRRQRRRRKRKTLRFVVVIPVAFFFSSHEKRRNFCCFI